MTPFGAIDEDMHAGIRGVLDDVHRLGRLPVVTFSAGGIATPADASLMMRMGMDGIFVGSGIFRQVTLRPWPTPSSWRRPITTNQQSRRSHGHDGRDPHERDELKPGDPNGSAWMVNPSIEWVADSLFPSVHFRVLTTPSSAL